MQRKPSFPVANCNIKMPDLANMPEPHQDDDHDLQRRQQLINFGHSQWGFNNWSWTVTKQDLDFVDFNNGKYCAGVASFVLVAVKSLDVRRENVGYATSSAHTKGLAIYKSRKAAVTNALRETLLSFGGAVTTELLEASEAVRETTPEPAKAPPAPAPAPTEPKNSPLNRGTRPKENVCANENATNPLRAPKNAPPPLAAVAPVPPAAAPPRAPRPAPPQPRPNSNVSFVLQPVMPPLYTPPRLPPPAQLYPNYYEYAGPWHFAYEYERPMPPGNVNLNFNMPPRSLVVNGRGGVECKAACRPAEGEPLQYAGAQPPQGCWIKPTIFYDGFWTEQKVKKWVAEQVEKQFPEDGAHKPPSPGGPPDPNAPK